MQKKRFPLPWRMEKLNGANTLYSRLIPGQRTVKTGVAVTLCLLFYMLKDFQVMNMPAEAAITAIICMQPFLHDTAESARNRLLGTFVGALWGFLFLVIMALFPALGKELFLLYPLIGLGTLITLHSAVLLGRSDASGVAAIVFVCVVIAYPDIENPLEQAFSRILDVILGTFVAILVNSVHLPRAKQQNKVFFIPVSGLTDEHYAPLSAAIQFRLQSLLRKDAKLCLISEHAPAFQTAAPATQNPVPMIVMDGAAIYDPNENMYLATTNLDPASCRWLMKRLENQSFFIYTVHRDRNFIYHHGEATEMDRTVYSHLKRSPYRYYLDDDHFSVTDVVYIKLVTTREQAEKVQHELEPMLEKMKLRSVIRPQAGLEDGCGLYFYAAHADQAHARAHLMQLLRQKDPGLEACLISGDRPYSTEADAVRLLRKVDKAYEPLLLTERLRKKL
ncbi:MAG: FUSC family protein [Oscillospiraceae bacterium]|nr:FUSC family protein [Oscillospiraceae bacterium]